MTHIELHHSLAISYKFFNNYTNGDFTAYLLETWPEYIQNHFHMANAQIQNALENYYAGDQDINQLMPIPTFDLYHIILVLFGYMKNYADADFIYYLKASWSEALIMEFTEVYDFLHHVVLNFHANQLNHQAFTSIPAFELSHILAILIGYLKVGGDPDRNEERDQVFINYLSKEWNVNAQQIFWESYDNIRQELLDYYAQIFDPESDEGMLAFINSIS